MSSARCLKSEAPGILSFSGPDAVRYLNGQLTQDVRDLGSHCLPSCVTDAKGRLQHFVEVMKGVKENEIWVITRQDDVDQLRARLEQYLIADDVEVDDLSGKYMRIHADQQINSASLTRDANSIFEQGWDNWWISESIIINDNELSNNDAESLRIKKGITVWEKEITPGMLAPEAGLDKNAISYHKGCYIGQEVLSRIKTAGKLNRRLARLNVESASVISPIVLEDVEVGNLTSISPEVDANGLRPALGYIKKKGFDAQRFQLPGGGLAHFVSWV